MVDNRTRMMRSLSFGDIPARCATSATSSDFVIVSPEQASGLILTTFVNLAPMPESGKKKFAGQALLITAEREIDNL